MNIAKIFVGTVAILFTTMMCCLVLLAIYEIWQDITLGFIYKVLYSSILMLIVCITAMFMSLMVDDY